MRVGGDVMMRGQVVSIEIEAGFSIPCIDVRISANLYFLLLCGFLKYFTFMEHISCFVQTRLKIYDGLAVSREMGTDAVTSSNFYGTLVTSLCGVGERSEYFEARSGVMSVVFEIDYFQQSGKLSMVHDM